jgi:tripartite-type tricarboxylate transporter receptor subunit TctC
VKTRLAVVFLLPFLLTAMACGGSGSDSASDGSEGSGPEPAEFYADNGLRIVTANDAGGGFDFYMRTVARAMERIADIRVTSQNLPGGGGTLGDNTLAKAEADGSTIGLLNYPGHVFAQLSDNPAVQYDFTEWEWLGRVAGVAPVITVGTNSGFGSVEDLANSDEPIKFGVEGKGSDAYLGLQLFSNLMGIPIDIVTGYGGPGEIAAAIARGEIAGTFESIDTALPGIEEGETRALAIFAEERDERLPDVPTAPEVAPDDEKRETLTAFSNIYALERVFAAPPGTPSERVDYLRDLLSQVFADERFREEMAQAERSVNPLPGAEVEQASQTVAESAEELIPLMSGS